MSRELPGQRTGLSITQNDCLYSSDYVRYGRGTIDAANSFDGANTNKTDEIRAGTPMGKITATGLWVPCKRTAVTTTGTVTALVVDDARAFKAGDVISVGADTGLTVTAIDYTTNTMTIASTAVVAGEAVICTSLAGSELCRGFLNETVRLLDSQPFGTTWINRTFSKLVFAGMLKSLEIVGDLAAIRAAEYAATTKYLRGILWDDEQGQS